MILHCRRLHKEFQHSYRRRAQIDLDPNTQHTRSGLNWLTTPQNNRDWTAEFVQYSRRVKNGVNDVHLTFRTNYLQVKLLLQTKAM